MLIFLPYFPRDLNILVMHFFLLLHVRVNIEVESCSDVGMTKQYTYGLVVAVALNATSGKSCGAVHDISDVECQDA